MNNVKNKIAVLSLTLIASVLSSAAMAQVEPVFSGMQELATVQMINLQGRAVYGSGQVRGSIIVNETHRTMMLNLAIGGCPMGAMCIMGPRYLTKEFLVDNEYFDATGARHIVGHLNTTADGLQDTLEVTDYRSSNLHAFRPYLTVVQEIIGAISPVAPKNLVVFGGGSLSRIYDSVSPLLPPAANDAVEGVVTESVEN